MLWEVATTWAKFLADVDGEAGSDMVLGGVTQSVTAKSRIPVFMAH